MVNPTLPYDILLKIVILVAEDNWWLLGPILRAGRVGRDLVYHPAVLYKAEAYSLCYNPEDIQIGGRRRTFFERVLAASNPDALYYEGLRLVCHEGRIYAAIDMIKRNVPKSLSATLACAVLTICSGDTEESIHYLQCLERYHFPLLSDRLRERGNSFKREIALYGPPRANTFRETFKYPTDPSVPNHECAMDCVVGYGPYENLCHHCALFWLAHRVALML